MAILSFTAMLILFVCCTARTSLLMQLYCFGIGDSVTSTLHGHAFFTTLLFLEVEFNSFCLFTCMCTTHIGGL